jgi:ligand-binding sensor domain-containing protein
MACKNEDNEARKQVAKETFCLFRTLLSACRLITLAAWLVIALCLSTSAQQLPIKTYTSADGLAQNNVSRAVFDTQGFLWFCTREGLSRFDGYKFTNYGTKDGLPDPNVTCLVENAPGEYWLGTDNGLVYFNAKGQPAKEGRAGTMFTVLVPTGVNEPLAVNALLKDKNGRVWCGTDIGLLQVEKKNGAFVLTPTHLWQPQTHKNIIKSLFEDRQGRIWAGSRGTIYYQSSDGSWVERGASDGVPKIEVLNFCEDRDGRIWAGTGRGLLELESAPQQDRPLVRRIFGSAQGLPGEGILSLWRDARGVLWLTFCP